MAKFGKQNEHRITASGKFAVSVQAHGVGAAKALTAWGEVAARA